MYKINYYFLFLVVSTYLIPIVSGLPFTPAAEFYMPIWFFLLFITCPSIFHSKGFLVAYFFLILHFIYFAFSLYPEDRDNKRFLLDEVIPIMFSFSLLEYFQITKQKYEYNILVKFSFLAIILTTLTSFISLSFFPDAARELAGGISDNNELSAFYNLIGIGGFYFYFVLALCSALYIMAILKTNSSKIKIIFLVLYALTFFTVVKAQYAASLILFIMTSIITICYLKVKNFFTLFILVSIGVSFFINKSVVSAVMIEYADNLNMENLSPRIKNIAYEIEGKTLSHSDEDLRFKGDYDDLKDISMNSFKENVFTGGGKIGDHVFWYDVAGNYGIVGFIPWLLFFYYTIVSRSHWFVGDFKGVFYILVAMLIYFGFHKPFRSFLILPYITFFIPAILLKFQNWILFKQPFFNSQRNIEQR